MKTKILKSVILSMLFVLVAGCNGDEPLQDAEKEAIWRKYYAEKTPPYRYLGQDIEFLLEEGTEWFEAEYPVNAPQNYKIVSYKITSHKYLRDCHNFTVYKDGEYFGEIEAFNDGNICFLCSYDATRYLLYNFKNTINSAIGYYYIDESSRHFTYFKKLDYLPGASPYPEILPVGWGYNSKYLFSDDIYGGLTIVNFGSTAGFFTPAFPVEDGFKRLTLQAYRIDLEWLSERPPLELFQRLYQNKCSEITEYIDADFWK